MGVPREPGTLAYVHRSAAIGRSYRVRVGYRGSNSRESRSASDVAYEQGERRVVCLPESGSVFTVDKAVFLFVRAADFREMSRDCPGADILSD